MGKIYWITGLAGAGKTTIGTALYYKLREQHDNVVILDGDILKKIVNVNGYLYEDRLNRARHYSYMAKVLADQGMIVIICTIAMFDEIREWNRQHMKGYVEVFLDVDLTTLKKRNRKGLYTGHSNIAGIDTKAELPKNPDIVLKNDGKLSVSDCVEKILEYEKEPEDLYDRDTEYWNAYYRTHTPGEGMQSDFAEFIQPMLKAGSSLIELGCGNGRDSLFFIDHGIAVTGIDASEEAIKSLNQHVHSDNALFICDDFVKSKALYQKQYDYCYSRFTWHSITEEQEDELMDNLQGAVKDGGKLFIEARSVKDDIFGKGIRVAENSYIYNDHFRRFIDMDKLISKLERRGFTVSYAEESRGFAPHIGEDPVLIRIEAVK